MKTCVFAGTFDPVTNGHIEVVDKALQLFDKVIVALGVNPEKHPYFSKQARLNMLKEAFSGDKRVEVCSFEGLLVDFMRERGIEVTIRGIRNNTDLEYEKIMRANNQKMYPEIQTLFLECSLDNKHISSTLVRERLQKSMDISRLVPPTVEKIILQEVKRKNA